MLCLCSSIHLRRMKINDLLRKRQQTWCRAVGPGQTSIRSSTSILNYRHAQRRGVSISFHAFRGSASRRTAFHRIYARALPLPPVGAEEEAGGRAGWGDEGECSAGDRTKPRYGLLFWNRCTRLQETGRTAYRKYFSLKPPVQVTEGSRAYLCPGDGCRVGGRPPLPPPRSAAASAGPVKDLARTPPQPVAASCRPKCPNPALSPRAFA
jgi:hypothetical protein